MSIYLADTAAQNALSLSGYAPVYQAAATAYNYPANVLAAQGFVESSYNPNAYNPSGATGIAQFMPSTAAQYGVNPANPVSSIYGQAQYDANLLAQNGGNMSAALEQYSGNTPGYANQVLGVAGQTSTGNTPGYANQVLGVAGQTSTNQPQYLYQLMNNAQGVNTAPSSIMGVVQNAQGINGTGGVTGTALASGNAFNTCQNQNCGYSPSCWWDYFICIMQQDALTAFLVIVALLLVIFGVYKMVSGNGSKVVPVPV